MNSTSDYARRGGGEVGAGDQFLAQPIGAGGAAQLLRPHLAQIGLEQVLQPRHGGLHTLHVFLLRAPRDGPSASRSSAAAGCCSGWRPSRADRHRSASVAWPVRLACLSVPHAEQARQDAGEPQAGADTQQATGTASRISLRLPPDFAGSGCSGVSSACWFRPLPRPWPLAAPLHAICSAQDDSEALRKPCARSPGRIRPRRAIGAGPPPYATLHGAALRTGGNQRRSAKRDLRDRTRWRATLAWLLATCAAIDGHRQQRRHLSPGRAAARDGRDRGQHRQRQHAGFKAERMLFSDWLSRQSGTDAPQGGSTHRLYAGPRDLARPAARAR